MMRAALVVVVFGLIVWAGSVQAESEPEIIFAPICCEVKIPACFCWPAHSWPEPPCPDGYVTVAAGDGWPEFCAAAQ